MVSLAMNNITHAVSGEYGMKADPEVTRIRQSGTGTVSKNFNMPDSSPD